jgi:predicted solute-binding protein
LTQALDCGDPKPRVCAVSYLNTVPLVWGALHGPQKNSLDLTFEVPSVCAERVASAQADVGLVPVIEMDRCGYRFVPDVGIACRGAVRSILLVSQKPFPEIRSLATDTGSRTSVQLARIILQRKYHSEPVLLPHAPDLDAMLQVADAALLIGDAALAVDPTELSDPCLDLGEEWADLTGLPMVFALWSGPQPSITPQLVNLLQGSCHFGLGSLDTIVRTWSREHNQPEYLVHQYLTRNVQYYIGEQESAGLARYLSWAKELPPSRTTAGVGTLESKDALR